MSQIPEGAKVAVLMGSTSDWPVMEHVCKTLEELSIAFDRRVISAHRRPGRLVEYIDLAERAGVRVFIGGAGGAAHLCGVIAGHTNRPVLGVPMKTEFAGGLDSLLSMVQMPKGVPVGTLATGKAGAINAAILAGQILGIGDEGIARRVAERRHREAEKLTESPE